MSERTLLDRVGNLYRDTKTIIQGISKEPLITSVVFRDRDEELHSFARLMAEKSTTSSSVTALHQEIAEFHFRRPILLLGMDKWCRNGWVVRPFWRDHIKIAPPLPSQGRSGKLYKHNEPRPCWD